MNLNDFFLSKKDKNNINSWLKTFDKPLYVSGKTGIGKTMLVNTILKDYTQVIIDHNLISNISKFIYKTIYEKDISMMFSKKEYKSIIFDNILYTDRIIIKELKNIITKKHKNPIVIISNNINNKQIQSIISKCLHIHLQYTFQQFKYIVKSKYNYITDDLIYKSNFNFHAIQENMKYFKNNYLNIIIQDIDSHEEDINILTKNLNNYYTLDELFINYSCDYNVISLNLLDDIYKSINNNNIKDLLNIYNSLCIYDNYELFKSKYNLYTNTDYSIFYSICYPYYILHNSSLKLSKNISYNSYISRSLIYTHIRNLVSYFNNDYEFYDLLIKLIYNIHKDENISNSKSAPNLFKFFYLGFLYILRIFATLIRRKN